MLILILTVYSLLNSNFLSKNITNFHTHILYTYTNKLEILKFYYLSVEEFIVYKDIYILYTYLYLYIFDLLGLSRESLFFQSFTVLKMISSWTFFIREV